jgi:23S rRNA pseudouridine1911/1915/1917 synthase
MIERMSQPFQFQITDEEAGLRVDQFLALRFGGLSRMRIRAIISAGNCLVNHKTAQAGARLASNDSVELRLVEGAPTAMSPEPLPLEILYEDTHLIVVVKPAGLLVHPTKSVKRGTLANALVYHLNREFFEGSGSDTFDPATGLPSARPVETLRAAVHGETHPLIRPGIVHRLDRATSGLMVIAKTSRALSTLSRHFHRKLVRKRYLALVEGLLDEDAGTINAPILRDPDCQPHWRVGEGGKEAVTRFLVRERIDPVTLVELEPVTGRTNQLRIHCAYTGHPILGDELYCGPKDTSPPHPSAIPGRLCLHAWRLGFHHPANGEWLEFASPLPEEVASVIDRGRAG